MPSKYGFTNPKEVRQQEESKDEARRERIQKEATRIDPLITDILSDFCTAIDLADYKPIRMDEQWSIVGQDNSQIFTAILDLEAGQPGVESCYLRIDDRMLSALSDRSNLEQLRRVLHTELVIPVVPLGN